MNQPVNKAEKTDYFKDTVLIIDDTPANLGVIMNYLKAYNFKTPVASNGEIGFERAKHIRPDIILLDVMMPGIDGFETCKKLKSDEITKDIPVIFMTALTDTENKVRGFSVGGVDYITKPVQQEEVLARVNTHLNIRKLQMQLKEQNKQLSHEIEERKRVEAELVQANAEILSLNEQLKSENLRMKAELDVTRKLQQMILPDSEELRKIQGLDIACFMEPADEVGGDYCDVLRYNGQIKIGIGDVAGHGLESGILMLMTQTAVRTLLTSGETNPMRFLDILNRTIFDNVQRMKIDKMLTLSLLDYFSEDRGGRVRISGFHEDVIIARRNGTTEIFSTSDLGTFIGLIPDIAATVSEGSVFLEPGDGIILYSDGITEAHADNLNPSQENLYGLERLCNVISSEWGKSAENTIQAVIEDVRRHVGAESRMLDDLALVVMKQQ